MKDFGSIRSSNVRKFSYLNGLFYLLYLSRSNYNHNLEFAFIIMVQYRCCCYCWYDGAEDGGDYCDDIYDPPPFSYSSSSLSPSSSSSEVYIIRRYKTTKRIMTSTVRCGSCYEHHMDEVLYILVKMSFLPFHQRNNKLCHRWFKATLACNKSPAM